MFNKPVGILMINSDFIYAIQVAGNTDIGFILHKCIILENQEYSKPSIEFDSTTGDVTVTFYQSSHIILIGRIYNP